MESKCRLVLNNVAIEARNSDGFINATQLCKAGGKEFKNWFKSDLTQQLISTLETSINSHTATKRPVVYVTKGRYGGSWVHPQLATALAIWLSPVFYIQVTGWIEEWKQYHSDNQLRYMNALRVIEPNENDEEIKEQAV